MTPLIRNLIIAAVLGTACIGAAVVYGPPLAKNIAPQFFVGRAALNLYQEFAPMTDSTVIVNDFLRSSWRQESTLRISSLEGEFLERDLNFDPAVLSALPMLSLRNVTRWDSNQEALASELSLQMAATGLLNLDLYMARDKMAVNIPMMFDFPIVANPRRLGSEWDVSLGGWIMPGIIDDALFYQLYSDVLFAARPHFDIPGFINSLAGMARYVEFEYEGRHPIVGLNLGQEAMNQEAINQETINQETGRNVDVYRITLPAQQVNNSMEILLADAVPSYAMAAILFTDDLIFTLYVDGSRMAGVDFEGARLRFPEPGLAQFSLSVPDQTITNQAITGQNIISGYILFDNSGSHQVISFNAAATGLEFTASAEGQVRVFSEAGRIETNLTNLGIESPDLNISLNLQHLIFPDTEPVLFDAAYARLLTDLNISDLLGVLSRIEDTPLGAILGGS